MKVVEDIASADSHTAWDLMVPKDDTALAGWLRVTMGTADLTDAALILFSMPTADRMDPTLRARIRSLVMAENESIEKGRLNWSPKENWVDKVGGLPKYIEDIALALIRERGMPRERAIPVAINRVKLWAAGGGNVNADTRAKAAKAVAEWEAKKKRAKADNVSKGTINRPRRSKGGNIQARAARGRGANRRLRDGDGDGFVLDGKPGMRPATPAERARGMGSRTVGGAKRSASGDLQSRAARARAANQPSGGGSSGKGKKMTGPGSTTMAGAQRAAGGDVQDRAVRARGARGASSSTPPARPWNGVFPDVWKDSKYDDILGRATADLKARNTETPDAKNKTAATRQVKDFLYSAIASVKTPDDVETVADMLREISRKNGNTGIYLNEYARGPYWDRLVDVARKLGAVERTTMKGKKNP